MNFEEIKFTDAQILSLQPNDVIVLRMKGRLRDEAYEHLKNSLNGIVTNKVIVLEEDAELSVLRIEEVLQS